MARVTVEDCIENIPNRFELVVLAAQRAKQISSGSPLTLDRDNDKDSVVALREIADKTIETEALKEDIIHSQQRLHAREEFEAVPFAGEIEDQMKEVAERNAVLQEGDDDPLAQMQADMAQDMHFEDENIDPED